MAQGQFTKEEAAKTEIAFWEIINSLPKRKMIEFVRHMNDIYLFLTAAKNAAPTEAELLKKR